MTNPDWLIRIRRYFWNIAYAKQLKKYFPAWTFDECLGAARQSEAYDNEYPPKDAVIEDWFCWGD